MRMDDLHTSQARPARRRTTPAFARLALLGACCLAVACAEHGPLDERRWKSAPPSAEPMPALPPARRAVTPPAARPSSVSAPSSGAGCSKRRGRLSTPPPTQTTSYTVVPENIDAEPTTVYRHARRASRQRSRRQQLPSHSARRHQERPHDRRHADVLPVSRLEGPEDRHGCSGRRLEAMGFAIGVDR